MIKRLAFPALVVVFACGGQTIDPLTEGGSDATPLDGDHCLPGTPNCPYCPSSQPTEGSSCIGPSEGVECEYGSDPRWTCNTLAMCTKGQWLYAKGGDPACPTPAQNPQDCPASFSQAQQGGSCSSGGEACKYAQGWCACSFGGGPPIFDAGGPSYMWMCAFPNANGCPPDRPKIGTPCQGASECDYGVCGAPSGTSVQCNSKGLWEESMGGVCAGAN